MEQNNNRLDELFNLSKNDTPKVSFEQTKQTFLNSLDAIHTTSSKQGIKKIFTLKNIIIMIVLLNTILLSITLFFTNLSEPKIKKKQIANKTENSTFTSTIQNKAEDNIHENSISTSNETTAIPPIENAMQSTVNELKPEQSIPSSTSTRSKQDDKTSDNDYQFPNLTPKEIKANNKLKARMTTVNSILQPYGCLLIPGGETLIDNKTIQLNDFYMKQTEVTNLFYRVFLFDLLIQGRKDEFLKSKPDQKQWGNLNTSYSKQMADKYFSDEKYNNYPVVNISREAAQLYCQWLADEINKTQQKKLKGKQAVVNLPSDQQWIHAASDASKNFSYPWMSAIRQNTKGCFFANYKYAPDLDTIRPCPEAKYLNAYTTGGLFLGEGVFTVEVTSYNPNGFGLYCMSGNVAEMVYYVDENNAHGTKGGSWNSIGDEIKINAPDKFKGITTPNVNIGFRTVVIFTTK